VFVFFHFVIFITAAKEVMFSSVHSVVFVCLFVSGITQKP